MTINKVSILNKKTSTINHVSTYEPCLETMALLGYSVSYNKEFGIIECENDEYILSYPINTFKNGVK